MNYYEEFGIPPDATSEEIRQAYKALARLVHPDVHSDQKLRNAAEREMRRINAIFDVLINPQKRKAYDEGLLGAPIPGPVSIVPARAVDLSNTEHTFIDKIVASWFWIVIGSMAIGVFIWLIATPKPSVVVSRPRILEDASSIATTDRVTLVQKQLEN